MVDHPGQPDQRPAQYQIQLPPELEAGEFSDLLSVWHTAHGFTLDFAVMQQIQPPQNPEDPSSPFTVPCRIVARLKIPPTLVFDIMKALNQNLTTYEEGYGEIRRPDTP